ncbi:type II secretion system protein [Aliarcobacter butzleri]|uniref:type II secretion system protein n=1 Tax=Aliarcobacter butzleri TaxID=28197 RepID=UPI0021B3B860|nr:type II secretion system protein [Aliarcobacter butzleri]MCT7632134.1 type II secretion system GspH family protein [Aliarcobacter butzleri]
MRKLVKKGFSGIELVLAMAIITVLMTVSVDTFSTSLETSKEVTTKTVIETEADNAVEYILKEGIRTSQLYITTNYVSELNSQIDIKTTVCSDNKIAHKITIIEQNAEYSQSFTTCDSNSKYVFTTTKI